MKLKGVTYDAGSVMYLNWRPDFDPKSVSREIEIIKNDLHCDAIRISGLDINRLTIASEIALRQGLIVTQQGSTFVTTITQAGTTMSQVLPGTTLISQTLPGATTTINQVTTINRTDNTGAILGAIGIVIAVIAGILAVLAMRRK